MTFELAQIVAQLVQAIRSFGETEAGEDGLVDVLGGPAAENDNAFLAVDDVAALQAAADKLSPDIILTGGTPATVVDGCENPRKDGGEIVVARHGCPA